MKCISNSWWYVISCELPLPRAGHKRLHRWWGGGRTESWIGAYTVLPTEKYGINRSYRVEHKDAEAAEVEKFVEMLKLNNNIIFGNATYQINITRQTRLRSISSVNFTLLRDELVSRLTMFIFRRGGEPARLHITDWQDPKIRLD